MFLVHGILAALAWTSVAHAQSAEAPLGEPEVVAESTPVEELLRSMRAAVGWDASAPRSSGVRVAYRIETMGRSLILDTWILGSGSAVGLARIAGSTGGSWTEREVRTGAGHSLGRVPEYVPAADWQMTTSVWAAVGDALVVRSPMQEAFGGPPPAEVQEFGRLCVALDLMSLGALTQVPAGMTMALLEPRHEEEGTLDVLEVRLGSARAEISVDRASGLTRRIRAESQGSEGPPQSTSLEITEWVEHACGLRLPERTTMEMPGMAAERTLAGADADVDFETLFSRGTDAAARLDDEERERIRSGTGSAANEVALCVLLPGDVIERLRSATEARAER